MGHQWKQIDLGSVSSIVIYETSFICQFHGVIIDLFYNTVSVKFLNACSCLFCCWHSVFCKLKNINLHLTVGFEQLLDCVSLINRSRFNWKATPPNTPSDFQTVNSKGKNHIENLILGLNIFMRVSVVAQCVSCCVVAVHI